MNSQNVDDDLGEGGGLSKKPQDGRRRIPMTIGSHPNRRSMSYPEEGSTMRPSRTMRPLERQGDGSFRLVGRVDEHIPPYAILSHTWGTDENEVTFQDLIDRTGTMNGRFPHNTCIPQTTLPQYWQPSPGSTATIVPSVHQPYFPFGPPAMQESESTIPTSRSNSDQASPNMSSQSAIESCECGMTFTGSYAKENLSRHRKHKHDGSPSPKGQPCDLSGNHYCGTHFKESYRRDILKRHMRIKHGVLELLSICGACASALAYSGDIPVALECQPHPDPGMTAPSGRICLSSGPGFIAGTVVGYTLSTAYLFHLNRSDFFQAHFVLCGIVSGLCVGLSAKRDLHQTIFEIMSWTVLLSLCMSSLAHRIWRDRTNARMLG